jgi:hypothetical protein
MPALAVLNTPQNHEEAKRKPQLLAPKTPEGTVPAMAVSTASVTHFAITLLSKLYMTL